MEKYESKSSPAILFLYSSLVILGVYSLLIVHNLVTLFILLVLFLAMIFHYSSLYLAKKEYVDWIVLRDVVETIIKDEAVLTDSSPPDTSQIVTQEIVELIIPKLNKEFVDQLRVIGIDGILVLLFLLLQKPTLNSVKNIHEAIKIPMATLYRDTNKLMQENLIREQYIVDQPKTAYYQITEEGERLMEELRQVLVQYQYLT